MFVCVTFSILSTHPRRSYGSALACLSSLHATPGRALVSLELFQLRGKVTKAAPKQVVVNSKRKRDDDYLLTYQCQSKLGLHLTPVMDLYMWSLCIYLYFNNRFRLSKKTTPPPPLLLPPHIHHPMTL